MSLRNKVSRFLITISGITNYKKNNPDNSDNGTKLSVYSGFHQKQAVNSIETGSSQVNKQSQFTGIEIPLSGWKRSFCTSTEYPAFDEPEPILLPDALTEQLSEFTGFAYYETTFELDNTKTLFLEISDTTGGVEVFMNGETADIQIKPPYHYDLSSLVRKGKNYLAVEVAINLGKKDRVTPEPIRKKMEYDKQIRKLYIVRSVKLYTN
jgi:hypothetical protein